MGLKEQSTKVMATDATKDELDIQSWDDWFEACGQVIPLLEDYEEELGAWYACIEKDDAKRMSRFSGHHNDGFYRDESKFPTWRALDIAKFAGIGFVVGFVVMFIISLITTQVADVTGSLVPAVLVGVLAAAGAGGAKYALIMREIMAHVNKLDELADKIRPALRLLPPKYRNSIVVDYMYQTYLNYTGAITYQQACDCVQSFLQSLSRNDPNFFAKTFAVLFDASFTSVNPDAPKQDLSRGQYEVDMAADVMQNEYLPKDIVNKVFAGEANPEEKLRDLIGLSGVKRQVSQMRNRMEFHSDGGGMDKIGGNHMCFLGSPGTGKTTIARILTRFLYDFGYISENKCVEVDGAYFKSPYVGQTGYRTQAIIDFAMGGVLFIDEAYLMLDKNTAGTEATGTLLKAMEDRKEDFVVIFAGYEDAVNRLLASNEGFASRIKHKVYFEDFNLEELMAIFDMDMQHYSKNATYIIEPDARALLEKQFDREREAPTFGNARTVRNALDKILDVHADNFMNHRIDASKKFTFTVMDVEEYVKERVEELSEDTRNYIAAQGIDSSIISMSELKGRTKEGSVNPDADMESLIGLQVVKDEIAKMKAQFEFYGGKMGSNEGHHMCFVGAPGTGKTTVAKIMTGYLYKMGIIQRNEYVDVNGDFLRGSYLGQTGKRTQATVQYAQGAVLFVDEAYLLQQDDRGDSFGQEAIGVLIDAMEKHRKNFVVIVAGYDREMQAFLDANSGMRSRITHTFHFKNYSPKELAQMMRLLARKDGFKVERDAWIPIQKAIRDAQMNDDHFGNARFIRSYWESLKQAHIFAFAQGKHAESERYTITASDVTIML